MILLVSQIEVPAIWIVQPISGRGLLGFSHFELYERAAARNHNESAILLSPSCTKSQASLLHWVWGSGFRSFRSYVYVGSIILVSLFSLGAQEGDTLAPEPNMEPHYHGPTKIVVFFKGARMEPYVCRRKRKREGE